MGYIKNELDVKDVRRICMIYKDFKDKKLSALGLGAMRLPIMNGDSDGRD